MQVYNPLKMRELKRTPYPFFLFQISNALTTYSEQGGIFICFVYSHFFLEIQIQAMFPNMVPIKHPIIILHMKDTPRLFADSLSPKKD